MNWTTLVSAEDLHAALGSPGLLVVDCRALPGQADADAGLRAWQAGHLPGAPHVHLERDLADTSRPAVEGRHPLPAAADFCAVLVRLGISPDSQVVAYDAADGSMAAARFWWMLRLLGHRRVAVLDGGYARWQSLGLPTETTATTPEPGRYSAEFDRRMIADTDEVEARSASGGVGLLDARAAERFRGEVEPLDPVAGHIPGARNRPLALNLDAGRFKPPAQLRAEFEAVLTGLPATQVILNCGSGVTACHNLLAMEYAGLQGARVYAASWSGWVADRSRPVATGPG